jgi:hypothetical protein
VLGELRRRLDVGERRRGAEARLAQVPAAQLDRAAIGRAEGVRRIVTGGAGHRARARQRGIAEHGAADLGQCRRQAVGFGPRQAGARLRGMAGGDADRDGEPAAQQEQSRTYQRHLPVRHWVNAAAAL